MKRHIFLFAIFALFFSCEILAREKKGNDIIKLRVAVLRDREVIISAKTGLIISCPKDIGPLLRKSKPYEIKVSLKDGEIFLGEKGAGTGPVRFKTEGKDKIEAGNKLYRGEIEVRQEEDNLVVINEVPLEEYLFGVVAREVSANWPLEALKAQAIAARTYALYHWEKNQDKTYHLESSEYSQVYSGIDSEDKRIDKAVLSTSGLVMTYKGGLIQAFFHSCCGGRTEDINSVWSDINLPYLRSKICSFCRESKKYNWQFIISRKDLEKILSTEKKFNGKISDLRRTVLTRSERVSEITLRISGRNEKISASDFRRWLGADKIPGTLFKTNFRGDNFIFTGRGSGHGLGMCQEGAKNIAAKRYTYERILKFYYTGIKIEKYRRK